MNADLLWAAGGIGLFLCGMVVLTSGLRALSGPALRRVLTAVTKTPASGALAGALMTAAIQSSSATTVAAVGFVGAGLMTFPQAIGVIFGANIGTTVTGWLVALGGFTFDLASWAAPLLLAGVLLRLFGGRRFADAGWSVAGLCLLFLGIDAMKDGLAAFEGVVTPASFPDDTFTGRLLLAGIGALVTVATQSSSAGVAAALVALSANAISLPQAAAMVIGMNVGTTATALLATLGGSADMRRTGFAHVLYNVLTGVLAFALLTPFAWAVSALSGASGNAQLALVAFHTCFNVVGVLVMLPFAGQFAALIVRLVPERRDSFLRPISDKLLSDPAAALDAAGASVRAMTVAAFSMTAGLLEVPGRISRYEERLAELRRAIAALRRFEGKIQTGAAEPDLRARQSALLHALDHLERLLRRLDHPDRLDVFASEPRLIELARTVGKAAAEAADAEPFEPDEEAINAIRRTLREERDSYRGDAVGAAVAGRIGVDEAIDRLDGIRWLHRVSYHLWRLAHHVPRTMGLKANGRPGSPERPPPNEPKP